jgi:hypothetical protein
VHPINDNFETEKQRELVRIVDRLNELYQLAGGLSNGLISTIFGWAYGARKSVAADVHPDWSARHQDLDPPTSFFRVSINIKTGLVIWRVPTFIACA